MPYDIPPSIRSTVEQAQQQAPILWLVELELDRGSDVDPPVITRFTDHHTELQWPLGDPDETTWVPFPFQHSGFKANSEGDMQTVDLSVDNAGLLLMPWLFATNGLEGNRVVVWQVSATALELVYPDHEGFPIEGIEMTVLNASADAEAVTLKLGDANFLNLSTPTDRYQTDRCINAFASGECGYVRNEFAGFLRCSKLLSACIARAADMKLRGLPPILPGNHNAYPGIGRRRRAAI